jgi:hypothetical protein
MLFWPYAYVSYYYNGFQMYDVSDPNNITRVAYYNTSTIPVGTRYEGAWGIYTFGDGIVLISDMQNGLFILNVGQAMSNTEILKAEDIFGFYPNPNLGQIYFNGQEPVSKIELIDLNGRKVFDAKVNSNKVSVPSEFSNGIYILRSWSKGVPSNSKLILDR